MSAPAAFPVFAFLWALALLLHLSTHTAWALTPAHAGLTAACALVLLRPGSVAASALVSALLLAVFAIESPKTANHLVLFAVAAATMLAALGLAALEGGRPRRPDAGGWLERFAPVLRVELLVLYFFAVFHKLNWDYLDPDVSCAVAIFRRAAPDWLEALLLGGRATPHLLVFGSLALEAALPLLLAVRGTRPVGIAGGVLFHAFLGVRFPAFSTGLFALYALFVPAAVWERAAARLAAPGARRALRLGALAFAGVFALGRQGLMHPDAAPLPFPPVAFDRAVVTLWALAAAGALVWLLVRSGGPAALRGRPPGGALPRGALWLFPALLMLNGFSPYLGLRTVPTFSMFSNLKTEGGRTNHVLMPDRALRVAGYQEDLVKIEAARPPGLQRYARRGTRLVWFDLQRIVREIAAAGGTGVSIAYVRDGRRRLVPRAERDPELVAEPSWLARKWLRFRPAWADRGCHW